MISKESKEAGDKGEILFRQLLDRLRLPFLYIRQEDKHVSKALKEDQEACNPDFQINLHDLGNPYFDVKVSKFYFLNSGKRSEDEKGFALNNTGNEDNGIDHMTHLQREWLAPVWVAFIERKAVDANKRDSFYLISLNTILAYHHCLKELLGKKWIDNLRYLFLPLSLMQVVNDETDFGIKSNVPTRKDIQAWAERYGKVLKSGKPS